MSKRSEKINNYILLVDGYTSFAWQRTQYRKNLAGRYRVGAKSEKAAIKILKRYLGKLAGNPRVYYKCEPNDVSIGNEEILVEFTYGEMGTELFASGDCRIVDKNKVFYKKTFKEINNEN